MTRDLIEDLPYVIGYYPQMQALDEHNESHSTTGFSRILRGRDDMSSGNVRRLTIIGS